MSGLAFIDVRDPDPIKLFLQWKNEQDVADSANSNHRAVPMCLATASKDGKVSNRNVLMKEFDGNGFTFITDKRSRKAIDIEHNTWVAATFLWKHKENLKEVTKQIRVEGRANLLPIEKCQEYYEKEPLYCKIRAKLCVQDKEIDWRELKTQHDAILQEVEECDAELPMPNHVVGYCIVPEKMDFYYAFDHYIADRVVFKLNGEEWKCFHVAA